jgi:hypothetical protein
MQKTGKYVLNGLTIVTAILMTTNGALAQATIDGGAKPYFIVGGAMAATFFVSVGAILLRKGHRYLRFAAAAAQWPTVAGKVVSTDVVKRIERTQYDPSTYFVPLVHYVYNVDGVSRDGSVIQAGLDVRGYSLSSALVNTSPSIRSVQEFRCDMTRRALQTRYLNLGRSGWRQPHCRHPSDACRHRRHGLYSLFDCHAEQLRRGLNLGVSTDCMQSTSEKGPFPDSCSAI